MTSRVDEPTADVLQAARRAAIDAALHADELEAQARKARRVATARMKHYEDLVMIHQGQLTLPYDR